MRLSSFIAEFCESHALNQELEMMLNLVAEEAFVNVVMHGFDDSNPHEISFGLALDGNSIVVTLEDDAKAFNPLTAPEFDPATPLEQRRAGGLGIHLLRNIMDELHSERVGAKNRLTMRKTVP